MPPIGTIGFGIFEVYSDRRVPYPPAKIITLVIFLQNPHYSIFQFQFHYVSSHNETEIERLNNEDFEEK